MSYLKIDWQHSLSEYPREIHIELDDERFELRKVEVFSDGRLQFAPHEFEQGGTVLAVYRVAQIEDLQREGQFTTTVITKAEFESIWARATGNSKQS